MSRFFVNLFSANQPKTFHLIDIYIAYKQMKLFVTMMTFDSYPLITFTIFKQSVLCFRHILKRFKPIGSAMDHVNSLTYDQQV